MIPNANKSRLAFEEQYYRNSHYVNDYHAQFPGDKTIYFDSYYSDEGIANDFVLEQRDENNKMFKLLRAKKARISRLLPKEGIDIDIDLPGKAVDLAFADLLDIDLNKVDKAQDVTIDVIRMDIIVVVVLERVASTGAGIVPIFAQRIIANHASNVTIPALKAAKVITPTAPLD